MEAIQYASLVILIVGTFELIGAVTKLPSGMSQHQYCLGCIATVKELEKALSKRHLTAGNREAKIMDMIEKICAPPNFVEYEYSPPKTVRACELLLENHEEDLESALVNSKSNVDKLICHEVSGACIGIDPSVKSKPSKYADIDLTAEDGAKTVSKTVKVDPHSGQGVAVDDEESKKKVKNEGKTLSTKDKKQKKKDKKKKDTKKKESKPEETKKKESRPEETKTKESEKKRNNGKQKGAVHHMNVDINDPGSMEKILAQIKDITGQQSNEEKDEL